MDAHAHAAHDDIRSHVKTYFMVFGALMVLTIITVAVSYLELATPLAITVALIVAAIKGSLVALYFMHLRWDSPFNGIVLIASMFFVALFIGLAILDTREYQHTYDPPGGMNPPGAVEQPAGPTLPTSR